MKKIQTEQSDFFNNIAALAFVNPFGQERELADCSLLNIAPGTLDIFQRSNKIQLLLFDCLQKIQSLDEFKITSYSGNSQKTMRLAWLFYQFHGYWAPTIQLRGLF